MKMKAFYSLSEAAEILACGDEEAYKFYLQTLIYAAHHNAFPLTTIRENAFLPGGVSYIQTPGPSAEIATTELKKWLNENFSELRPAGLFGISPLAKQQEVSVYRTGLVGRPTSWDIIKPEFERRWKQGDKYPGKGAGRHKQNITKWAEVLSSWLQEDHPQAVPPKGKTLPNKLTIHFQSLK